MTKPTDYPDWALNTVNEIIKLQKDGVETTVIVTNKVKPSDEYISDGNTSIKNKLLRQHYNFMFNNIGLWIRYFDSLHSNTILSLEQRVADLEQQIQQMNNN